MHLCCTVETESAQSPKPELPCSCFVTIYQPCSKALPSLILYKFSDFSTLTVVRHFLPNRKVCIIFNALSQ